VSHLIHDWRVSKFDDRYLECTGIIPRGKYGTQPCPARSLNPAKLKAPAQQHSPTSVKAADEVQRAVTGMLRAVLVHFAAAPEGLTDDELIAGMGRPNTVRPRRVDLHRLGYIRDSQRTRKTAAGKDAVVWEITEEGRRWASKTTATT
jgi:hypothetical protein